jgi:hypothetical protein
MAALNPTLPSGTSGLVTVIVFALLLMGVLAPLVVPSLMDSYRKRRGLTASSNTSGASSATPPPSVTPQPGTLAQATQAGQDALTPLSTVLAALTKELDRANERAAQADRRYDTAMAENAQLRAAKDAAEDDRDNLRRDCSRLRDELDDAVRRRSRHEGGSS